jgi:hypothetical protein
MISAGIALASLLFAAPGNVTPPKKAPAKGVTLHKSKVPITVTTVFGAGKATVTLRFDQAVEEAVIGMRGLDGLHVTSQPLVDKTSFTKGEILTLDVPFTPGPGRSHLVVDLEGKFRGQRRMAVQTFAVGDLSAEQLKAAEGTILTTTDGQRLKVLPVKQD